MGCKSLVRRGLKASISGAHSALDSFAPVIVDTERHQGRWVGSTQLSSLLKCAGACFCPLILPLLLAALVGFLLAKPLNVGTAISVVKANGVAQTFPAVIERAALPALRAALERGNKGCFSAFQAAARDLGKA